MLRLLRTEQAARYTQSGEEGQLPSTTVCRVVALNAEVDREPEVARADPMREPLRSQHGAVLVRYTGHLLDGREGTERNKRNHKERQNTYPQVIPPE